MAISAQLYGVLGWVTKNKQLLVFTLTDLVKVTWGVFALLALYRLWEHFTSGTLTSLIADAAIFVIGYGNAEWLRTSAKFLGQGDSKMPCRISSALLFVTAFVLALVVTGVVTGNPAGFRLAAAAAVLNLVLLLPVWPFPGYFLLGNCLKSALAWPSERKWLVGAIFVGLVVFAGIGLLCNLPLIFCLYLAAGLELWGVWYRLTGDFSAYTAMHPNEIVIHLDWWGLAVLLHMCIIAGAASAYGSKAIMVLGG